MTICPAAPARPRPRSGARTLATMSASAQSAVRVGHHPTPASAIGRVREARRGAGPRLDQAVVAELLQRRADCGVIATRFSPSKVSFGTPISWILAPLVRRPPPDTFLRKAQRDLGCPSHAVKRRARAGLDYHRPRPGARVHNPHHVHRAVAVDEKTGRAGFPIAAPSPAGSPGVPGAGGRQPPPARPRRRHRPPTSRSPPPPPSMKNRSICSAVCRPVASCPPGTAAPCRLSPTGPAHAPPPTTHITFTAPLRSTKKISICSPLPRVAIGAPGRHWFARRESPTGPCQAPPHPRPTSHL